MFVTSWGHVVLEGKHSGKISHIDSSRCIRWQTPENFSIVCFLNHSFCIRILYPDFGRLPSALLPNSLLFSLTCCHLVKNVKLLTYSFCVVDLNSCLFTHSDCLDTAREQRAAEVRGETMKSYETKPSNISFSKIFSKERGWVRGILY